MIYPPVAVDRFEVGRPGEHYLIVSELVAHKQIATAVRAFSRLGRPLIVVGDGPELRTLRRHAGPSVRFPGRLDDSAVERLMSTCRAFVVTATEEFGIAAVEAQAAGRPVIARRGGGVLETVIEGETGTLWEGGAAELVDAVRDFDDAAVDPDACVRSASRFGADVFRRELPREVHAAIDAASVTEDTARRELLHAPRRAAFGRRRASSAFGERRA